MRSILRGFLFSLPVLLPLDVHGQQAPTPVPSLAITNVSVVDVETGSVKPDMTVLIHDGRIVSVAPAGDPVPSGAEQFDGRGKFMIPGLWDMHVHLSYATESALPVLIANGVTGVRDLGGDLVEVDGWRARIQAGDLTGPRILRAGPMLNGKSFNPYQLVTGSPEQARGIVRALKQVGTDFVKIHRRVPREDYFAVIDEAKAQGLQVVGHIPMTVTPEEASDAGQLIEHVETFFEGTFSAGLETSEWPNAIRRWRAESADSLFGRLVRNQTVVTPILSPWRYLIEHPDTLFLADPRMRYVPRSQREEARQSPPLPSEHLALVTSIYDEYREVVRMMNRSGVLLLAGSDLSIAHRVPGFSLHDELSALVDAGLTPLQALQAATLNPARYLEATDSLGTVEAGKLADLVLLEANPLEDIQNTQKIAGVVLNGRYLDRAALDALLEEAEAAANR